MKLKFYFIGLGMGIIVTAIIMGLALGMGRTVKETMTDEEVLARARELGMVESTVRLSEGTGGAYGDNSSIVSPDPVSSAAGTADSQDANETDTSDTSSLVITGEAYEEEGGTGADTETDQAGQQAGEGSAAAAGTQASGTGASADGQPAGTGQDGSNAQASSPGTDAVQAAGTAQTGGTQNPPMSGGSIVVTVPDASSSETVCDLLQQAGVIDDATAFNTWLVQTNRDRYIGTGAKLIPRGASYEEIGKILTGR